MTQDEKRPVSEATRLIARADTILVRHWTHLDSKPQEIDLVEAKAMEQALFRLAATTGRLLIRLERLWRNEPESVEAHRIGWDGI